MNRRQIRTVVLVARSVSPISWFERERGWASQLADSWLRGLAARNSQGRARAKLVATQLPYGFQDGSCLNQLVCQTSSETGRPSHSFEDVYGFSQHAEREQTHPGSISDVCTTFGSANGLLVHDLELSSTIIRLRLAIVQGVWRPTSRPQEVHIWCSFE